MKARWIAAFDSLPGDRQRWHAERTNSAGGTDATTRRNKPVNRRIAILPRPGLYAVMNKWLPNNMSRPHFHSNDRFIQVLKSTWWTEDAEVVQLIVGEGPATSTRVEQK